MSTDAEATAVLAALNAVLPASSPAYDLDGVMTRAPTVKNYVEVFEARRHVEPLRLYPVADSTARRWTVRWVGSTVQNARLMQDRCRTALDGAWLTIGGVSTGPIQHETSTATAYDDGFYVGDADYIYTL